MSNFRNLLIWQKSMSLITKIYYSTNNFPKEEIFGLTSQIRRSSISIPSNIAEGYGRQSDKDFLRFLNISIGSLFEMQTQLEIAKNITYLNEEEFNNLYEDSREVERMLVSFINKLKNRN
ncbi:MULTISPECIES: four helix bundle protein [Flavobacterium]|uniref:Four helix bundle protein n=2 Tax=Flavobacterium TaxID=237 RepID=A0A940X7V6_9FLAO|nr:MULTISPECIES: four helix bundle protein [Flavobacterium]MBP4138514.1 four helix bundle protein [Flavobacterium geliluteum]MDX6183365.1 four helix bundle protein [Flavobacterium sp. Fl-33]MDX6186649.1 four helix bundle protein [Flavobacterium sp. Fl-77]UFH38583.1 four helix bundle protein [Flavobacterium sp. F-70]